MGNPAAHRLHDIQKVFAPCSVFPLHLSKPFSCSPQILLSNPYPVGKYPKTKKVHSSGCFQYLSLGRMKPESDALQLLSEQSQSIFQQKLIIGKQSDIINIANIAPSTKVFRHAVIHAAQINIRPELAGQISDRQTMSPLSRGQQIIPGKPEIHPFLRRTAVQDQVYEPQGVWAFDLSAYLVLENLMIQLGKYFWTSARST